MGALAGLGLATSPASQWLMTPNAEAGHASLPNVDLVAQMLDQNPILSSVGQMWNANPFHDIIPVDWAEVLRALRTVWLRSAADPTRTVPSRRRSEHADVDLGHRDVEQRRRTLAGHVRDARGTRAAGRRQAVRGAGMAYKPALSDDQGHVPAGLRFSPEAGRGQRSRPGRAGASALPPAAVRQRRQPNPDVAVQSGGGPPNDGNGWHQPGRRGAQPYERPEGRSPYHG